MVDARDSLDWVDGVDGYEEEEEFYSPRAPEPSPVSIPVPSWDDPSPTEDEDMVDARDSLDALDSVDDVDDDDSSPHTSEPSPPPSPDAPPPSWERTSPSSMHTLSLGSTPPRTPPNHDEAMHINVHLHAAEADANAEIATPLYSSLVMNPGDVLHKAYVEPSPLHHFECDLRPLTTPTRPASASIARALAVRDANARVFDPDFVHDSDPMVSSSSPSSVYVDTSSPSMRAGLHYVTFEAFRRALECCAQLFVDQALTDARPVEMWILYDDQRQGFQTSHVWTSLLVLPRLAPFLDQVRFVNVATTNVAEWITRDMHVVVVHDALVSSAQFHHALHLDAWLARLQKVQKYCHVHVLAPYIGPKFLLHHGIPVSTLAWMRGRQLVVDKARQKYTMWGKRDLEVLESVRATIEEQLGSTWTSDATSVYPLLQFMFPGTRDTDLEVMAQYVVTETNDTFFRDMWDHEHVRYYATTIMDSVDNHRDDADLTTFFFEHRMPPPDESTAATVFPRPVVPPYERWRWVDNR